MSTGDFSAYSTAKTTRIKFDRVLVESKSTLCQFYKHGVWRAC